MSARQLIVLVVAAIAALGALLLIRGMNRPHEETAQKAEPIAGEQVLVVTHDVPQGAALKPEDLAWRVFPQASVTERFIRSSAQPSALSDFAGAVTRQPFMQGAPLISSMVVQPGDHGFMSASLTPGMRAVSIEVKPETSVGGFVQPNDRIDVILTTATDITSGGQTVHDVESATVLQNIRVLAMDETVQAQTETREAPERVQATVVVLEMSADDAQILAQAEGMGDLSLSLRGVEAEVASLQTPSNGRSRGAHTGSVRVHAFGAVTGGGR